MDASSFNTESLTLVLLLSKCWMDVIVILGRSLTIICLVLDVEDGATMEEMMPVSWAEYLLAEADFDGMGETKLAKGGVTIASFFSFGGLVLRLLRRRIPSSFLEVVWLDDVAVGDGVVVATVDAGVKASVKGVLGTSLLFMASLCLFKTGVSQKLTRFLDVLIRGEISLSLGGARGVLVVNVCTCSCLAVKSRGDTN